MEQLKLFESTEIKLKHRSRGYGKYRRCSIHEKINLKSNFEWNYHNIRQFIEEETEPNRESDDFNPLDGMFLTKQKIIISNKIWEEKQINKTEHENSKGN